MEYTEEVQSFLRKYKVDLYHRVMLRLTDGRQFEGLIMPRGDSSRDVIVLKLSNGYNVAFSVQRVLEVIPLDRDGDKKGKNEKTEMTEGSGSSGSGFNFKKGFKGSRKSYVHVIGAGGTIASRVEYRTGAVYPLVSEEGLITAFPELTEIANLRAEQLFSLLSEDMTPELWKELAEKVYTVIKDNNPKGVVITHGTDTMHYTAAALSFMLRNLPCPIILTGAQRSSDRGSSDAKVNLLSSVLAAQYPMGEVGVCMHANMNDDYCHVHRGVRVRKMHTSRRDAFKSVNTKPLLEVDWRRRKVTQLSEVAPVHNPNEISIDTKLNTNVSIQYFYPTLKKKEVEKWSEYDGVVIVGTGLGHLALNPFNHPRARSLFTEIKELIDSGVPVVMSSQTIFGRINMNVYTSGRMLREIGVIGHLCDWTPETAYVKLMWVLGHTKKMNEVKEMMETNMVGEITEHSEVMKRLVV